MSEPYTTRHQSWFRGGLVFKAHRRVYHSTLGSIVVKKKVLLFGDVDGVLDDRVGVLRRDVLDRHPALRPVEVYYTNSCILLFFNITRVCSKFL